MQSLTLAGVTLLVATLLTGCGSESGPTGEARRAWRRRAIPTARRTPPSVEPLDEVFPSPCNGELIHYTGTARTQMNFVASPDTLFQHVVLHVVVKETGIGLTTGAIYTAKDNIYEGFTLPYGHLQFQSFRFHAEVPITTTTPGLSFGGHTSRCTLSASLTATANSPGLSEQRNASPDTEAAGTVN